MMRCIFEKYFNNLKQLVFEIKMKKYIKKKKKKLKKHLSKLNGKTDEKDDSRIDSIVKASDDMTYDCQCMLYDLN